MGALCDVYQSRTYGVKDVAVVVWLGVPVGITEVVPTEVGDNPLYLWCVLRKRGGWGWTQSFVPLLISQETWMAPCTIKVRAKVSNIVTFVSVLTSVCVTNVIGRISGGTRTADAVRWHPVGAPCPSRPTRKALRMTAPTLSRRDARALAREERAGKRAHWSRDERQFSFVVADQEARDHVRQVEYWSTWAAETEDEDSVRNRDATRDARYWEDMQVKRAEAPAGYTLRRADGTEEWVEPDTTTDDNKRTRTEAAADARRKADAPMTAAERMALMRWRKRARAAEWTCPAHPAPDLVDCDQGCREQHTAERTEATRASLDNVNVHAH